MTGGIYNPGIVSFTVFKKSLAHILSSIIFQHIFFRVLAEFCKALQ